MLSLFLRCQLLAAALFITACAQTARQPERLIPVEERSPAAPDPVIPAPAAAPDQRETNQPALSPATLSPATLSPVILALMDEASAYQATGHADKAMATLERALRIEPGNAMPWHQLATVRLQQRQYQQAIALARKSNVLAGNNRNLKNANWELIATCYSRLKQPDKARAARNNITGPG